MSDITPSGAPPSELPAVVPEPPPVRGPEPRPAGFRLPLDYYSDPVLSVRPLVSPKVAWGCGAVSLLVLIGMFVAGGVAGSGKGGSLFATLFGTMQDEVRGMFTKDVTAAEKQAFEAEMTTLRQNLAGGKVSMDKLQPLIKSIRDASGDNRVTPQEVQQLTAAARDVNRTARK